MASTIDIPCPKCGELVMCDYLKGSLHELMFFRFMRTSFRVECACGFKKTYYLVSEKKLAKMYEPRETAKPSKSEA